MRLSYCEQVSTDEYEQQRHDVAHDALLQLLDDIIDNNDMTPTTKQRRLTQVPFISVIYFLLICLIFGSGTDLILLIILSLLFLLGDLVHLSDL